MSSSSKKTLSIDDMSYRPNGMIDNCLQLPLSANNAFDIILSVLNHETTDKDDSREYSVNIEAIANLLNTDDEKKNIYRMIREGFSFLMDHYLVFIKDGGAGKYRAVDNFTWNRKAKSVSFRLNTEILEFMGKQKGCAYYHLRYVLALRGKYSARLYYHLKRWTKTGHSFNSIDSLKKIAGFTGENKAFCKIIEKAVKEINEKTDLNVVADIKKSRKDGKLRLTNINFVVKEKETKSIPEEIKRIKDAIATIYGDKKIDLLRIAESAYKNKRSAEDAIKIAEYTLEQDKNKDIADLTNYACACMKKADPDGLGNTGRGKRNRFNNFTEREYDWNELEADLLKSNASKRKGGIL